MDRSKAFTDRYLANLKAAPGRYDPPLVMSAFRAVKLDSGLPAHGVAASER